MAQCTELYRELVKVFISPLEADQMELWQIAALFGQSARDVAEDPDEMNRRIIEARYRAAAEGRELDPDEVFGNSGMTPAQIDRMVAAPRVNS